MAKGKGKGWHGNKIGHSQASQRGWAHRPRVKTPWAKPRDVRTQQARATIVRGKVQQVPQDEYLYLDRSVKDTGAKGYDTVADVDRTSQGIVKDYRAGVISKAQANARFNRLALIVRQTKQGELVDPSKKARAFQLINFHRSNIDKDWKPLTL